MASTHGSEAGPSSPQPDDGIPPLIGEVIFLPDEHYDDLTISVFKSKAKELKAEFSDTVDKCTIVLFNVNSPHWRAQAWNIAQATSKLERIPQLLPYHWLLVCYQRRRRVGVLELVAPAPFMVQQLTDRHPLKVWVSKNVHREANESPEEAYKTVMDQVEAMGAIIVAKRSHADVLVVDRSSKFFATVQKEKEDNHRDWQRLAQRDWVAFCYSNKVLQLTTPRDDDAESVKSDPSVEQDQLVDTEDVNDGDSMAAEEDLSSRKGPGRPTGKPRVEYSPEDDDFLVRWLACYYPAGSWTSQKTFTELIRDEVTYPPASRHTSQSWRERFKKNSAAFTRRVQRFVAEGIDASLKTRSERAKAAEKEAQRASDTRQGESSTDTAQQKGTISRQIQESADLAQATGSTAPPSVAASTIPAKRALVEHDSDEPETGAQDRKGKGKAVLIATEEMNRVLVPETIADDRRMEVDDPPASGSSPRIARPADTPATPLPPSVPATSNTASNAKPAEDPSDGTISDLRAAQPIVEAPRNAISTQPASAIFSEIPSEPHLTTPSNRQSSIVPEDDEIHRAGSTPLRQQIRSIERRRRNHGHSSSARRLSKRAASPDKVYAFVNLPPPRPVVEDTTILAAQLPTPQREPPRELTPVERAESVLAGSRIVQDVAAQYRAKVASLRQRFGVGVKEISAATNEVKLRTGGKAAVDWAMLEAVLEEQYGR